MTRASYLAGLLLGVSAACSASPMQLEDTSTDSELTDDASTEGSSSTNAEETGESSTSGNDLPPICESECSTLASGDCPTGQKCTISFCQSPGSSGQVNNCVDLQGDKELGESCEFLGQGPDREDDCAEGLICWDEDQATGLGSCVAFCQGTRQEPVCAEGTLCRIRDRVVILCHRECDPFAPSCRANEVCVPERERGFICSLSGFGDLAPYGTTCGHVEGCSPGLVCIDGARVPEPQCEGLPGCCSPVCDLDATNNCPGTGQVCESYFPLGSVPLGYERVGVCALPQP